MSTLVYDADGRYYSPEEAEAQGIETVEMVEEIFTYTRTVRVAVHHPKGLDLDLIDWHVRNSAEHSPNRGEVSVKRGRFGEGKRDLGIGLNSKGQAR